MNTHAVRLQYRTPGGRSPAALELTMAGAPFAYSALPNTAAELEAADHREDLPATAHTHLCLYAAMRGVGGINTWGAGRRTAVPCQRRSRPHADRAPGAGLTNPPALRVQ